MSGSNSIPDDDWVLLDVGGKIFKTTKFTLSQHPGSFLARLVNGGLPSKQDKSGAFLIDRSYKHFDTILNYLRTGSANFGRNKTVMKDLLCEADFYNIEPLVDEIREALRPLTKRTEIVKLFVTNVNNDPDPLYDIYCSEKYDDYEVIQALRDKYENIIGSDDLYYFTMHISDSAVILTEIEVILRNFGFVEEFYDADHNKDGQTKYWKPWASQHLAYEVCFWPFWSKYKSTYDVGLGIFCKSIRKKNLSRQRVLSELKEIFGNHKGIGSISEQTVSRLISLTSQIRQTYKNRAEYRLDLFEPLSLLGTLYDVKDDCHNGIKCYTEALECLGEALRHIFGPSMLLHLANDYLVMGDYRKAKIFVGQAKDICKMKMGADDDLFKELEPSVPEILY